jgi:16S rRNA (adenine1518-N6/adenine1519-N6)-dimethyltransferase
VQVTEVKARLAAAGVRPSKGLGQHFLVDDRVANRQVVHGGVGPEDVVLEIGPGLGVLTEPLASAAKRVVAVEADRRLARSLGGRWPNVEVVAGDALEVPLPAVDVVVSNLPFQISSPVTFRLLELPFRRASLMYQEEFARRLVAAPGSEDYSRLTVKAYCRSRARLVETIPPSAFWPPPRVRSAIAVLEPRPRPFELADPLLFDRLVDVLFQHRRKKIATTLAAWRDAGLRAPAVVPFGERRVEELSPEELGTLANALASAPP